MAENRGKRFEQEIRRQLLQIPEVSVDRLHDQTTGFKGSQNICDFIVYKRPYEYYFECKSIHGNTFPLKNVTDTQWDGLLQKSKIDGVYAGVICWWVDHDVTAFISIEELVECKNNGYKSIRFDHNPFYVDGFILISGKKRRVFFDYDLEKFLS